MNKAAVIGIVVAAVVIGVLVTVSADSLSTQNNDLTFEPNLEKEGENSENEAKPSGRNLSVELDEKMGLSAP